MAEVKQSIGQASGPIIGGPLVTVYPTWLIGNGKVPLYLSGGMLIDNWAKVWPYGDRQLSADLARQVFLIQRAYQRSLRG